MLYCKCCADTLTPGIVRHAVNALMDKDDGEYVLLKDPMKGVLRLYKMPSHDDSDDEAEK